MTRVQTLPKNIPKVSHSVNNLFLREVQAKSDFANDKEDKIQLGISSGDKCTHFPRPSAEFRYKQELSETERSSLEAEIVVNGIIVENHES